jgi:hypothetical protein
MILQIIHTHFFSGHEEFEDWPGGDNVLVGWESCDRLASVEKLCGILRSWNPAARLVLDLKVIGTRIGSVISSRRSGFGWWDCWRGCVRWKQGNGGILFIFCTNADEDADDENEDEDEDGEYWQSCGVSCDCFKMKPGFEWLRRLGVIRLHLPRDGLGTRDAVRYVMDG